MRNVSIFSLVFIGNSIPAKQCFNRLKAVLPTSRAKTLDRVLTARCRLAKARLQVQFYERCLSEFVLPHDVEQKLFHGGLQRTASVCEKYLRAEVDNCKSRMDAHIDFLVSHKYLVYSLDFVSFIKFSKLSKQVINRSIKQTNASLEFQLKRARSWTAPGYFPTPLNKHITNLSSYTLNDNETQALCRGLKFCVPSLIKQATVDAEFEQYFSQLTSTQAVEEHLPKLKAELVSTAKDFSKARKFNNTLNKEHFSALKALKSNNDIVICKPDKGNAVVVLNKTDYDNKMSDILSSDKFEIDEFGIDLTSKIEKQVLNSINELTKSKIISPSLGQSMKPKGTSIPRMYGLPKLHKPGVPLRPILSMVNTPTHKLAQWLATVLSPIRKAVCNFTIKDSFEFTDGVRAINIGNKHMCSFDVTSLFTNVPLIETLNYIEIIKTNFDIDFPMNFDLLKSLILLCTQNVQFSFNQKLYFQKDGVAMGSPLGPILADIFVGYVENFLFSNQLKPDYYFRFVDDTFAVFSNEADIPNYLKMINSVHPNLHFTVELESNGKLPFLDVLVMKNNDNNNVSTCIYRKPTWSGLYLHFFSFVPCSFKRNLVRNLFDRARRICSDDYFDLESDFLYETLKSNGYPSHFIDHYSRKPPQKETVFGPEKKSAYLSIPFLGDKFSNEVKRRVRAATALAFPAVEPKFLLVTRPVPVRSLKDQLPISCASNVVYRFSCDCGSSYVGRTVRWLSRRAGEHLPNWIMDNRSRPRSTAAPNSAVTRHVMSCTSFKRSRQKLSFFECVVKARHQQLLPFLEATYIIALRPELCVQKESVMTLALPWR